jgi:hypothetical protein
LSEALRQAYDAGGLLTSQNMPRLPASMRRSPTGG